MFSKYKLVIRSFFLALFLILLWSCSTDEFEEGLETGLPYSEIKINNFRILTITPTEEATGNTIVIFPGGAYTNVCWESEGLYWAQFFASQGLMVYIVDYRLPDGNPEIPIQDGLAALQFAHSQTIDGSVGIAGFSAGGHLAAHLSTNAPDSIRPDFQILYYPVISMDWEHTHYVTRTSLLGFTENSEIIRKYSPAQNIDLLTPPAFIAVCKDDDIVTPINSLTYHLSLTEYGIPSLLKIYPIGGHGWSDTGFPSMQALKKDLSEWIELELEKHSKLNNENDI